MLNLIDKHHKYHPICAAGETESDESPVNAPSKHNPPPPDELSDRARETFAKFGRIAGS